MKASDEMEPHGQARDTSPNTPWGRTSRIRGPIHPRVNPWSSWCRDRENRRSIQGEGNVGMNRKDSNVVNQKFVYFRGHSCESRNPGFPFLDSHLRGNDTPGNL